MNALKTLWAKEPIVVVGAVLFIVTTVATQLLTNGVVTSNQGTNVLHAIVGIAIALGTWIGRSQVSPAA